MRVVRSSLLPTVQRRVFRWFAKHQRDLPWRATHDPYQILVSEIMLQQTQVDRVIPKYHAFLKRFPSVDTLAKASPRDVLLAWAGMGYNRRALYLHRLARVVVAEHEGVVPTDTETLQTLPGVGPYTAAAVATFTTGTPHPMADVNVNRVLSRVFLGVRDTAQVHTLRLRRLTEKSMPLRVVQGTHPALWGHALMDLGALVCKVKPRCADCPLQKMCKAYPKFQRTGIRGRGRGMRRLNPVPSSLNPRSTPDRILRGRIVRAVREGDPHALPFPVLRRSAHISSVKELQRLLGPLVREGMLEHVGSHAVRLARGA